MASLGGRKRFDELGLGLADAKELFLGLRTGTDPALVILSTSYIQNRSRSVVIPNVGGFAGVSVHYDNAKLKLGYRADFFFNALDNGIDTRQFPDVGLLRSLRHD